MIDAVLIFDQGLPTKYMSVMSAWTSFIHDINLVLLMSSAIPAIASHPLDFFLGLASRHDLSLARTHVNLA